MYLVPLCICVCVYVCVCVHSSHFILTSVVLTGLSWGAVLTDRQKEKQRKSEAAPAPIRHTGEFTLRSVSLPEKRKSLGLAHVPFYAPDTYRMCR